MIHSIIVGGFLAVNVLILLLASSMEREKVTKESVENPFKPRKIVEVKTFFRGRPFDTSHIEVFEGNPAVLSAEGNVGEYKIKSASGAFRAELRLDSGKLTVTTNGVAEIRGYNTFYIVDDNITMVIEEEE